MISNTSHKSDYRHLQHQQSSVIQPRMPLLENVERYGIIGEKTENHIYMINELLKSIKRTRNRQTLQ